MKIVLIGAGNVATRLGAALNKAGHTISQIYNRTEAHARTLGELLQSPFTFNVEEIDSEADCYIFSLKDDVIESVAASIQPNNGLWLHTSGSMPADLFCQKNKRYGVFYPLQTFSKEREVDFRSIPFFIESPSPQDEELIKTLAESISDKVYIMSSDKRKYMHLAAVFACNFTNHLYLLAEQLLEKNGIPGEVILPLIDETAQKIHSMTPREAQTGPAVRNDRSVIDKHMKLLNNQPEMQEIYELLSRSIYKTMNHE